MDQTRLDRLVIANGRTPDRTIFCKPGELILLVFPHADFDHKFIEVYDDGSSGSYEISTIAEMFTRPSDVTEK